MPEFARIGRYPPAAPKLCQPPAPDAIGHLLLAIAGDHQDGDERWREQARRTRTGGRGGERDHRQCVLLARQQEVAVLDEPQEHSGVAVAVDGARFVIFSMPHGRDGVEQAVQLEFFAANWVVRVGGEFVLFA